MNTLFSFNASPEDEKLAESESKFRDFLAMVRPILSSEAEQNFLMILENLKNSNYRLKNAQDFEEVMKLYKVVAPNIKSLSQGKIIKPKKKWSHEKVTLLAWIVSHYSILSRKEVENFNENDWGFISQMVLGWTANAIRFKWFSIQKSIEQKSQWTGDEDKKLTEIIEKRQQNKKGAAIYKWTEIAEELNLSAGVELNTRLGKHCRERWFNHLDPSFKKGEWTQDEDAELIRLMLKYSKKWSLISKLMRSRNENAVKNRFFSLKRRFSKLYKQMPQSEKKMLMFISERLICSGPDPLDLGLCPQAKRVRCASIVRYKKRCGTFSTRLVNTKLKLNKVSLAGMDSQTQLIGSKFSNGNTKSSLAPTQTSLLSFEKMESLKTAEILSFKTKEENLITPKEDLASPLSEKAVEKRRFSLQTTEEKEETDSKVLEGYYAMHLNLYEIPNMYKKPGLTEEPMMIWGNKNLADFIQRPFNRINEEKRQTDASNELSQIFSSMSLIDQYLAEGSKILSSLHFSQNPSSFSSGKVIWEERSELKRKTVNVMDTMRRESLKKSLHHKKNNSEWIWEHQYENPNHSPDIIPSHHDTSLISRADRRRCTIFDHLDYGGNPMNFMNEDEEFGYLDDSPDHKKMKNDSSLGDQAGGKDNSMEEALNIISFRNIGL